MRPWYFAHATSDFNTAFEKLMLEKLELIRFIENPNQPHHQVGYALRGMDYFYEDVLPNCYGCIFSALPTGHISSDVASDVEFFLDMKRPVFEAVSFEYPLMPIGRLQERRILTHHETRGAIKILKSFGNGGRSYV